MPRKLIVFFKNTQLPLNEDGNNLDRQLSYIDYKETVRKLHNIGWKKSYRTSAGVSMFSYGCGVSMYPQFFGKDSKTFQMLPRPYLISFYGGPGDQVFKKNGCWTWKIEQKKLSGNVLNPG